MTVVTALCLHSIIQLQVAAGDRSGVVQSETGKEGAEKPVFSDVQST